MILKNELKTNDVKMLSFDIDGTITQWTSVPDFLTSVLAEYNLHYSDEVMAQFFKAVDFFDKHLITSSECTEAMYGFILGDTIELLKQNGISGDDFRRRMFLKEADFTKAEEGIKDSVGILFKNYDLYCYTNWFKNQALKKLDKYGLTEYFKGIYAYDNNYIKFTKVGFLVVTYDLGLEVENVIHIGDSKVDIEPANDAGIQTILVDYNGNKEDLYRIATAVVTEFRDIPMMLERKR